MHLTEISWQINYALTSVLSITVLHLQLKLVAQDMNESKQL